jgi:LEA14-like dessication related protein
MKGLKTVSILAGLGLIGYAIYRYYLKQIDILKNITFKVQGIKIREFSKKKVSLDVSALIFNASNVEVTITQMYLDVYANGVKVGDINEIKDILIKPKQSTFISFNFSLDLSLIAKNIVDLITISVSSKDMIIDIKGYIKVKNGFLSTPVPFEYTTNLKK